MMEPGRLAGRDLVGLAVLGILWGATFPVIRLGVTAGASPFPLLALDFLTAAAVTAGVAVLARTPRPSLRRFAQSMLLGVLLIGGINLLLFWGIQFTTGGVAAILFATAPLLSIPTSLALGLGERPTGWAAAGISLGLVGVLVLGFNSIGTALVSDPRGLAALLGGAAAQAAGSALVARYRPSGERFWGQSAQFTGAGAAALLVAPLLGTTWVLPATVAVGFSIGYVALLTGVVGYSIYFGLIRRVGAVRANLVTYLNPVVALLAGAIAFGEPVGVWEVAGLILILAALAVVRVGPVGRPTRPPSPESEPTVAVL